MAENATGLVLRTRLLTETSLIVHWLTSQSGRIATVAKGARRPKSPFRGKLDLFYLARFSLSRSRHSDLHTLREVELLETHPELRHDLPRLRQASYAAALIERATETDTPLPGSYDLMVDFLKSVCKQPPAARNLLAFELKLLNEIGLKPNVSESSLNPGVRQVVKTLTDANWDSLAPLKLSETQITQLSRYLHGFLIYHLGKLPPGRQAALGG